MKSILSKFVSKLRSNHPKAAQFSGSKGQCWFYGSPDRAPSMADYFCGHETRLSSEQRLQRAEMAAQCLSRAADGATAIYCPARDDADLPELDGLAISVPPRIELKKTLPGTEDELMAGVRNSTTKEDLRRIRKAGFTYRVTRDPDDIRTFHANFYVPLVRQQFPDDGTILSVDKMLEGNQRELVCADLDGEWVGGIMNETHDTNYAMAQLGILNADETIRNSRVVSALLVRSMQRGVELGLDTTTLGFSLPFLGKGPIWFKAKWGCALQPNPNWRSMQVMLDLRHETVRQTLADCPIIHLENGALSVASWLEPGEAALKALSREAERYTGIAKWYMMGDSDTLDAAAEVLATNDRVVPIKLEVSSPDPIWLGAVLAERGASQGA